jgi:hypothetical protein
MRVICVWNSGILRFDSFVRSIKSILALAVGALFSPNALARLVPTEYIGIGQTFRTPHQAELITFQSALVCLSPNVVMNHSVVNCVAGPLDRLKIHLIARNFDQHECAVCIKSLVCNCGSRKVAGTQRTRGSFREVVDSILGMDPLIYVLVS